MNDAVISRLVDAIVVASVIATLLLIFGKHWFVSDESTMPLFIVVLIMISYRVGMWSGRKLERLDRETDDE